NSLSRLGRGGVLVVAEPNISLRKDDAIAPLLKAEKVLLVLPKWIGLPSDRHPGWLRIVRERSTFEAKQVLSLVAPRMDVVQEEDTVQWTANELGLAPNVRKPTQLITGTGLRPIIGSERGMLVGELVERNRTVLVLSDPDVISNHGLAREG